MSVQDAVRRALCAAAEAAFDDAIAIAERHRVPGLVEELTAARARIGEWPALMRVVEHVSE